MWRENDTFVNQNLAGGEVYTGKGGSEDECIDFFLIKENEQIFWLMGGFSISLSRKNPAYNVECMK